MIIGESELVHPSYVEIIKQMTSDEIKIINCLPRKGLYEPVIDITVEKTHKSGSFTYYENCSCLGYEAKCDYPDKANIYVNNLMRLGLVSIPPLSFMFDEWRYNKIYDLESFKESIYIAEKDGNVILRKKMIGLTDYGDVLRKVCFDFNIQ